MKVYQYVYCMSLVSQHYTFHWNWKCLSCAACDSAKLPLVTSMIVYLVGSVSDWPRWRTQTQTLSYHFFISLSTWQCFSLSIWSRWGSKAQITCIRWKIELQSSKALHVLITVRGCICSNHRFWRRNIDMTIVILKHCDHCR